MKKGSFLAHSSSDTVYHSQEGRIMGLVFVHHSRKLLVHISVGSESREGSVGTHLALCFPPFIQSGLPIHRIVSLHSIWIFSLQFIVSGNNFTDRPTGGVSPSGFQIQSS